MFSLLAYCPGRQRFASPRKQQGTLSSEKIGRDWTTDLNSRASQEKIATRYPIKRGLAWSGLKWHKECALSLETKIDP